MSIWFSLFLFLCLCLSVIRHKCTCITRSCKVCIFHSMSICACVDSFCRHQNTCTKFPKPTLNGKFLYTPLKTNMTLKKKTIFNRKYIFKWWIFHCHVSFRKGKFGKGLGPHRTAGHFSEMLHKWFTKVSRFLDTQQHTLKIKSWRNEAPFLVWP